jgi:protein SCO1
MRYLLFFLFSVFLFTACQNTPEQTVSADAKRYPMKGKVVSVDKSKKKASIAHEEIPGYMEAMTMDFPIKNEDVLNTLTKDAEVQAELVVDNAKGEYWLENISVTVPIEPGNSAAPLNKNLVQIGQEVPDFQLTNQDGKRISLNDFRGRALAITFIYSRCPLPNYCILMSQHFSDLANQLQTNAELKDKIRLLTISFDPETDTPETLKKYGLGYLGKNAKADFTIWHLATGTSQEVRQVADFFGLQYSVDEKDKTQFNHTLVTIIIAPDGKVRRVFTGNDWTRDDLLKELQSALK